jgi:hypothetical protein
MKSIKISILTIFFTLGFLISCKDDSLVIVPDWGTAVHGWGKFADGSPLNFIKGDPSVELSLDLLWNSIDSKNTVEKIEVYILFNEAYVDDDGNPKTAKHGGDDGELYMTLEGAGVPANRVATNFDVSQDDVFALYNGVTFDYDGAGPDPALPVWGVGSIKPDRDTGDYKFINGDSFQVRWEFTTDDGRVFEKWGISVCTEFPGASCAVNWQAICNPVIANPPGDWTISFFDSYGDGWNGAAIRVITNLGTTDYTLDDGFSGVTVVTIPAGVTSLEFEYVSGDWDSEASFTIESNNGNIVAAAGPSPSEGPITLDLCNE